MQKLDVTPTWTAILPSWLMLVHADKNEIKEEFTSEMKNMALAADYWQGMVRSHNPRWANLANLLHDAALNARIGAPKDLRLRREALMMVGVAMSSAVPYQLDTMEKQVRELNLDQRMDAETGVYDAEVIENQLAEIIEIARTALDA